jgi:hypothetical protein
MVRSLTFDLWAVLVSGISISLTFGSNEELVPYYYSKLTLDGDVIRL